MKVISKEIFVPSPGPGTVIWSNSFYTRPDGVEKMRTRIVETKDDVYDSYETSYSPDNGRTWSEWQSTPIVFQRPDGVYRRNICQSLLLDSETGRLVSIVMEGLYPHDVAGDVMTNGFLNYRVSADGGRTYPVDEQIIQKGDFTPEHPFECVWVGRNGIFTDGGPYIRSGTGKMIFPVDLTPLGPDGKYYNPVGALSYTDAAVLLGTWSDGMKIEWEISDRVSIPPDRSTRGAVEPTVAEMPDGRLLMVLRGSNDVSPDLPGCKWHSISEDGGYHWSEAVPWTYDDGSNFYSPSSVSHFITHSNGRCYWFGNITPDNPRGNSPRYPLVVGEVDRKSLQLIRSSMTVIDDLGEGDDETLQLSNFWMHEDRENGDIILHISRFIVTNWFADACIYRLEP